MKLLLFFSLLILGAWAESDPAARAKGIAEKQMNSMMEALKTNDKERLFKLVNTTKDDARHYPQVAGLLEGTTITVTSAIFQSPTEIAAHVIIANKIPGVFIMGASSVSPTGWVIKAVGKEKSDAKSRKSNWFTTCYIGIFWCVIELTIDALDRG